ncbi:hypothetical protein SEA_EFRA2_101 [Mycobacterium phage Efra2]|nr:hypothetical protein SEA_EFRA2_101 [Mycobacterium phage Efra2]
MSLAHTWRDWRVSLLDCDPQRHSCTQTALAPRNGALGPFPFQALIRAARPPIPARRSASRPSP